LLGTNRQKFNFKESWPMRGGAAWLMEPKVGVVDIGGPSAGLELKLLSPIEPGAMNWA
jgi:hypothetical protein